MSQQVSPRCARKLVDHLDQAILAKAFRGELVPQNTIIIPGPRTSGSLLVIEGYSMGTVNLGKRHGLKGFPCLPDYERVPLRGAGD
jgi:hypothetical protein